MNNWGISIASTLVLGTMISVVLAAFLWGCIITILLVYNKRKGIVSKFLGFSGIVFLYLICNFWLILLYHFDWKQKAELPVAVKEIGNLALIIWLIIALLLIIRYLVKYLCLIRRVSKTEVECEEYRAVIKRIRAENKSNMPVSFCVGSGISTPCSIGLIRKKILLPKKRFSEKELYYIFSHEYMHLKSGDLWIKFIAQICCCIMWWNPLAYWLKKELGRTVEIRCDLNVTSRMKEHEKAEYLQTILNCLKNRDDELLSYSASAFVGQNYEMELEERFLIVARENEEQKKQMKHAKILIVILMISVFLSYACISYVSFEKKEIMKEET